MLRCSLVVRLVVRLEERLIVGLEVRQNECWKILSIQGCPGLKENTLNGTKSIFSRCLLLLTIVRNEPVECHSHSFGVASLDFLKKFRSCMNRITPNPLRDPLLFIGVSRLNQKCWFNMPIHMQAADFCLDQKLHLMPIQWPLSGPTTLLGRCRLPEGRPKGRDRETGERAMHN